MAGTVKDWRLLRVPAEVDDLSAAGVIATDPRLEAALVEAPPMENRLFAPMSRGGRVGAR